MVAFQQTASERVPELKCGVAGNGNMVGGASPRDSLGAHQSMEFELQPEVTDCAAECMSSLGCSSEAGIIHFLGFPV